MNVVAVYGRQWKLKPLGYGGQSIVAKATGLLRTTLHHEGLEKAQDLPANHRVRIREAGGSRKKLTQQEPKLLHLLNRRPEGTPESALR